MKKNLIVLLGLLVIVLSGCGNTGGANAAVEADPFAAGNVYDMYYEGDKDPTFSFEFFEDQRVGLDELQNRKIIKFDYSLSTENGYDIKLITFKDPYGTNMSAFHKNNPYYYTVRDKTVYLVSKEAYFGQEEPEEQELKKFEDSDVLIREAQKVMKLKE